MTGVKQFPTRRASRGAVILIAAATLAGALVALPGLVAPDRASAAQRIAWGGTSAWDWKWETTSFSLPGAGVIDIWTTCRPRSTDVRHQQLLVATRSASWLRRINVPCDRQGRWIRRVGVPRNTTLTVLSHPFRSNGLFCYSACATGWTSVYTAS